jgi:hypothetical protein
MCSSSLKCTDLVIHARKILMNLLMEFDIEAVILDSYTSAQMLAVKTF